MGNNKWLIIVLTASMLANFALVGFIAGQASSGIRPGFTNPMPGLRRVMDALPTERQDALRARMGAAMKHRRPNMQELRRRQSELDAALTAQPFASNRLAAALEDVRANMCTTMAGGHETLVALAESMTPEERVLLAHSLQRPPRGRRGEPAHLPGVRDHKSGERPPHPPDPPRP